MRSKYPIWGGGKSIAIQAIQIEFQTMAVPRADMHPIESRTSIGMEGSNARLLTISTRYPALLNAEPVPEEPDHIASKTEIVAHWQSKWNVSVL